MRFAIMFGRMTSGQRRDRRRLIVIALITANIAGVWARMLFTGPHPVSARPMARVEPAAIPESPAEIAMRKWLSAPTPVVTRNLFSPAAVNASDAGNAGRIDKSGSEEKWGDPGTDESSAR